MPRVFTEINEHRASAALFLAYWAIAFALDVSGWRKPPGLDDMAPIVIWLHVLLPVMAGVMAAWWRRDAPGGITGGMIAGGCVLAVDVFGMLGFAFAKHAGESAQGGERITEFPVFLLAIGLFGSFLGLFGAALTTGLTRLLNRGQVGGASTGLREIRTLSRRMLLSAAGLTVAAALVVSAAVIPALNVGAMQNRAVMAFAANTILNVLIATLLLAAVAVRTRRIGSVLVVMAGLVALLLGAALLDAASAFTGQRPGLEMAACAVAAAGDLGAGATCLLAARGRRNVCPTISPTI